MKFLRLKVQKSYLKEVLFASVHCKTENITPYPYLYLKCMQGNGYVIYVS